MPISWGLDALVGELQLFEVNTVPLHRSAQHLDMCITSAGKALEHGDIAERCIIS
jgi:hypothetical protein